MKLYRTTLFAVSLAVAGGPTLALVAPAAAAPNVNTRSSGLPRVDTVAVAQAASVALADLTLLRQTADPAVEQRYVAERDLLAAQVAAGVLIDAGRMQAAWAAADVQHQAAVLAALTQLGVPYRRNTSAAGRSFDCSGLTSYAWGVAGLKLAHQSRSQIQSADSVAAGRAQAGDLVYYPGHVSLYLGVDRAIVHAVGSGRFVEIGLVRTGKGVRFGNPAA